MTYTTLLCCRDALRDDIGRLIALEISADDQRRALAEIEAEIQRANDDR